MKIKISLAYLSLLALAVVGVMFFVLAVSKSPKVEATSPSASVIAVATTSTSVNVTGAGSIQVLASSSNPLGTPGVTSFTRVYATICNGTANPVYISINGDKPTATGVGTAIIAAAAGYSSCFEITDRNLTQGAVRASSTVVSTSVSVTDYVQ